MNIDELQQELHNITFRMIQIEEWRRNSDPTGQLLTGLTEWKKGMDEWRMEQKQQWKDFIVRQEAAAASQDKARREVRIAVWSTTVMALISILAILLKK